MKYFNPKQLEAIKAVEQAFKLADKAGVSFWDNYGRLCAFSSKNITLPVPSQQPVFMSGNRYPVKLKDDMFKYVHVKNFHAGNADDPLYSVVLRLNAEKI